MSQSTLVDRDGKLYVSLRVEAHDKPETLTFYYPTGLRRHLWDRDFALPLPLPLTHDPYSTSGEYNYWQSDGRCLVRVLLQDGRETKPAFNEIEPLPCPKVRKGTETRWEHRRWEKLLKNGWTAA